MIKYEKVDFDFSCCSICNKSLKSICKEYKGATNKIKKLIIHILEEHKLTINDYLKMNNIEFKKCDCGCNNEVTVFCRGKDIVFSRYFSGHMNFEKKKSMISKLKKERIGNKNPMYKQKPWNKNLKKENNHIVKQISEKIKGRQFTSKHKENLSKSAFKRTIHGHTGIKHSEETKEIIRQKTLEQMKKGKMPSTNTKPHKCFADFLYLLNIDYEEEKTIYPYSFDFYLPDCDTYIEVDGDYYHSNPKIYKNGPIHKIQLKNYNRDSKKNRFCEIRNMKLIRYYEYDILNNISGILFDIKEKINVF